MIKSKSDLVDYVHEHVSDEVTKKDTKAVVEAVLNAITESIAAGDPVSIPGFGTFEVKDTAARMGRNLQTGEAMEIPAGKRVCFKPGAALKAAAKG